MTRSMTLATDSGGRIPIKRVMNHWVAVSSRKMPREERWATGGWQWQVAVVGGGRW
jgi:alpha-D-ribose 1-methylphosphonate 5-phosphate C-P lyase